MRIEIDDVLDWSPTKFMPFSLKFRSAATSGMLLGGPAPDGVLPRHQLPGTYYLMTIPLDARRDLSLFPTRTAEKALNPTYHAGEILDEQSMLVQLVEHERGLPRAGSGRISTITSRTLGCELGSPDEGPTIDNADDFMDLDDEISDQHRLGGPPKFYQFNTVMHDCIELSRNGFRHVLQLCSFDPGDDRFPYTFPFGEYPFHLFVRRVSSGHEYRYIWL
jgi:hypothetical protein